MIRAAKLLALNLIVGLCLSATVSGREPRLKDVLSRLEHYLTSYESELATLVAEEDYEQSVQPADGGPSAIRRTLTSEFGFLRLPGRPEWLGLRDTFAVDGQPEEFISALRSVAGGGCAFDPVAMEIVLRTARGVAISRRGRRGGLSSGERKILPLIAAGKTNREIGAELYLSENTVKTYVSNLLKKLHVARRSEAAAYIARQQLSTHLR